MARVIISEYKAKGLLSSYFGYKYEGFKILKEGSLQKQIKTLQPDKRYVIKVDEGIKKREKSGFLFKDIQRQQLKTYARKLFDKKFNRLLIEEYIPHSKKDEKFIALERVREGIAIYYSNKGGVDIENQKNTVKKEIYSNKTITKISNFLKVNVKILEELISGFDKYCISFLESNPFIIKGERIIFLDLAIEVDDTAEFFVNGIWSKADLVTTHSALTPEELSANLLAEKSPASFKLNLLNPQGNIFTLFSGGGASIVLADEIYNKGKAKDIVDYAEYSGNPNDEETYLFTKIIISLAKKSPAKNKLIYIAGGVANFTDIRITFRGIIRALDEESVFLKKHKVKIYVRRGGPYQEEGLEMMRDFLDKQGLLGEVYGPEKVLTEIIK
ncbi:hypothetical protein A2962_04960 [Candidatus Woesebacteria bacterium RIFCSPLOWO2_01_FULL_39_61]|uniref:ATP-citrate synthase citrate-binding domain-containing protein n=1 Tax=Candidatus Woesebacteria bacterium RIFCSPHIGHO2_02_FULL_39_13 TaxID=1802505 RepID=A0A1F7Z0Y2_9BACT|nr:MAG: hypothetical protein A2692_03210 [Candidatus Woesebacteria bacterium RIFCSPHIGHO2_01_FULL_39_95]OGM32618.1 MAG: hypothetical protein A3D01_05185 [Candidatus Woesebacteria bacterium RIFCSPHIGHO2_02_FULL_39_13]OGM36415.1 MAG: hypothetical protein A3E13_00730 [Candidatus Woesebacteria bacterium RIFCSPHIGHO2_12_FULL_40_20]OGM66686.1 MAG: hypothetical protein A2962_04960 [Candidatus Woesebacteria bacterium RIFCSPLOWO2_01_FULL_39_61]OGM73020.1 MAG: hypothetical protein A3H19_03095 [Candidatus